jgi:hypothetical protein
MECTMTSDPAREALRMIQTGLDALGHGPGSLDGRWGIQTRGAVERLLAVDGQAAPGPAVPPPPPGARLIRQGTAGYPVRELVLHCAATRPDWMVGRSFPNQVAEIRRWHVEGNRWRDIGYHHVIGRGGEHAIGRPETAIGAHVIGHNAGTIGVCLLGGHGASAHDRFADHFTLAQAQALSALIAEITQRTAIARITGHNHYAAKACPGFHVPSWLTATRRS